MDLTAEFKTTASALARESGKQADVMRKPSPPSNFSKSALHLVRCILIGRADVEVASFKMRADDGHSVHARMHRLAAKVSLRSVAAQADPVCAVNTSTRTSTSQAVARK